MRYTLYKRKLHTAMNVLRQSYSCFTFQSTPKPIGKWDQSEIIANTRQPVSRSNIQAWSIFIQRSLTFRFYCSSSAFNATEQNKRARWRLFVSGIIRKAQNIYVHIVCIPSLQFIKIPTGSQTTEIVKYQEWMPEQILGKSSKQGVAAN